MTAGTGRRRRPARRAAGRRLLPHPGRAVRHDAARRPRRRGGQGRGARRRRHPHLAAAGPGGRRRPTTWASTATSGRWPWTSRTPATPRWRRSWPGGPTSSSRTSSPAAWPASGWTTTPSRATNPGVVYASISGFGSGPGGAALPGYDLIVQAISRLHEPDRRHRRRAVPGGRRAVRRHGRPARHHRRPVRAEPPARDRRGPARRGEPAVLGAVGAGQPDQRVRRRRRRPVPDGQQPPEPVPVRAAALRRRGADRHRRQRRPVPPARARCSACPELADDPRFGRNEDRTANRDELRPLLVERLRTRPKLDWFRDIIAAGVPCGPINTIDQGVAFAEEVGLDPVVTVGEGAAAVPSVRNPITFSATAPEYRLPPPTLDEHGDEIRRWLAGRGARCRERAADVPDRARRLEPARDHAARPGPGRAT